MSRAALPGIFKACVWLWLRYRCETLWDEGKVNVWFGVLTSTKSRAIQCTQASRYMVRIHSGEGDGVSYVSRWITADDPVLDLLSPSPSPWHGPQFEVLRVEVFRFSSSKISIFELSFLPEPTTRAVCREEGPETEFATAGT